MKIFLSAVSDQFRDCRNTLASDLRAVGAEVKVQEDFPQHGRTLLEKLEAYIAECDRVIALIGDAYGCEPPREALPANLRRRSYSQWEYYFAMGQRLFAPWADRKDVYVYFAKLDFLAERPVSQSNDEAERQREFIAAVRQSGEDRGSFGSLDELRANVLRDGFKLRAHSAPPQNLPYSTIGTLFKGRDEFLAQLRQSLEQSAAGHATAIVGKAVHGLGGVGKTRLAVEYAWQHAGDYTALLFVAADTPVSLHRNLAELAGPLVLNLPENDAVEEDVRVAAAFRWLADHPGWFLILDNVDTPEAAQAAEDLIARLRGGHVLITSRLAQWSAAVEPLELDVLTPESAADFLLTRTARSRRRTADDAALAAELARELDGLALALEQSGAYIAQRRCSIADYLERWHAHERIVLDWYDARVMKYPRSVAVTWETTLQQLGPSEVALLRLCSWLAPEPIPRFLFVGDDATRAWGDAVSLLNADGEGHQEATGTIDDALVRLLDFSMIKLTSDGKGVGVHRVVQEVMRRGVPDERTKPWIELALCWVDKAATGDPHDVRTWPRWDALRLHIGAVVERADRMQIAAPTARLMSQLGALLDCKALYAQSEPFKRRALAIDEQSYGTDHPIVAKGLDNLALLLKATNRLGEAEPLMRRALAIDEQSYGADHPTVAIHLSNLAVLLKATNRPGEAETLVRRALAITEQSYGADHPDVAIRLSNLALLLNATNRREEAEPLMRRALAIAEQSYGADQTTVAACLNNLAGLLHAMNRLGEAEPLMRRALAIDEHSYGADHPNVATDLNNLAQLLKATNRLEEAEPLMRRALTIDEQSYGANHPDVATDLNNLAQLLWDTNRLTEAEPLMRRHLVIFHRFTRSTGHQHPHLLAAMANYAALLAAMGLGEAEVQRRQDAARAEAESD